MPVNGRIDCSEKQAGCRGALSAGGETRRASSHAAIRLRRKCRSPQTEFPDRMFCIGKIHF